jgi:hypothetical protein
VVILAPGYNTLRDAVSEKERKQVGEFLQAHRICVTTWRFHGEINRFTVGRSDREPAGREGYSKPTDRSRYKTFSAYTKEMHERFILSQQATQNPPDYEACTSKYLGTVV